MRVGHNHFLSFHKIYMEKILDIDWGENDYCSEWSLM